MENLKVKKIRDGTVIDHIPPGKSFDVSKILGLRNEKNVHVLLSNVAGRKGRKDVVKVENKFLDENALNKISIVAPNATINLIKNFEVVKKYSVTFPEKIVGLLKCPNPQCITNCNSKDVTTKFLFNKKMMCHYCERAFEKGEVTFL
jgi:aspartate carbamoyltransferase regulatory subunit